MIHNVWCGWLVYVHSKTSQKVREKMFNWSEVHLYRSNFLQNPYFKWASRKLVGFAWADVLDFTVLICILCKQGFLWQTQVQLFQGYALLWQRSSGCLGWHYPCWLFQSSWSKTPSHQFVYWAHFRTNFCTIFCPLASPNISYLVEEL